MRIYTLLLRLRQQGPGAAGCVHCSAHVAGGHEAHEMEMKIHKLQIAALAREAESIGALHLTSASSAESLP